MTVGNVVKISLKISLLEIKPKFYLHNNDI